MPIFREQVVERYALQTDPVEKIPFVNGYIFYSVIGAIHSMELFFAEFTKSDTA